MALSPKGRVSFPQVFEAVAVKPGDKPKFALTLIFDPSKMDEAQKKLFKDMAAEANRVSLETFKVKIGEDYKGKPIKSPFRKSEEKPDYMPPGQIFVRFSCLQKPGLVNEAKEEISSTSGEFYPGCWAHVSYTCFPYDNSGNRGVSFGLRNIQKTGDDEAFGAARTSPDEDFEVVGAPAPRSGAAADFAGSNGADDEIPF